MNLFQKVHTKKILIKNNIINLHFIYFFKWKIFYFIPK